MVNFAELKAKAEKAKDASVTKMTNTRDRYTSAPSSKVNWDPNWKRAPPSPATSSPTKGPPPPPVRSRADDFASSGGPAPPAVPLGSRPTDSNDLHTPPYTPRPPPTRAVSSGYPTTHRETSQDAVTKIDWANLSADDKEAFFGWLDEFFSRYLGIELGPREKRSKPSNVSATPGVHRVQTRNPRLPPTVNIATRPPM